jgi:cyclic-di-GMP phosphodiesterase TipF (flagellum assembly factor)
MDGRTTRATVVGQHASQLYPAGIPPQGTPPPSEAPVARAGAGHMRALLWTAAGTALGALIALAAQPLAGLVGLIGVALAGGAAGYAGNLAARQASLTRWLDAMAVERAAMRDMLTALSEQIATQDHKVAELERRSVDNPALVWRAASADIETLGSLVSDLAKTVARHEETLMRGSEAASAPQEAESTPGTPAPEPIPSPGEHGAASAPESPGIDPIPLEADAFMPAFAANDSDMSPWPRPPALSPQEREEWRAMLRDALQSDRLELCLQPAVTLPQRRPSGYEATLRLRGDGDDIKSEADLRRIAVAAGASDEIDRTLVRRAVQVLRVLRARGRSVTLTCAADVGSLLRPAFHAELAEAVAGDPHLARGLLLEIQQADLRRLGPIERDMLHGVSEAGVGLSVGGWSDLRMRVDQLRALGIRQVRVSSDQLIAALDNRSLSDIHIGDLATMLERGEIALVAIDVQSEQRVPDLLDLNVPYAAGVLFGAARPVRPEILEPRAVDPARPKEAAPALPEAPAESAPPARPVPPRQSFRSLLRRA